MVNRRLTGRFGFIAVMTLFPPIVNSVARVVRRSSAQKKSRPSLRKASLPSNRMGPVHPFGSLAALIRPQGTVKAHSFAPPPHSEFAIFQDGPQGASSLCRAWGDAVAA